MRKSFSSLSPTRRLALAGPSRWALLSFGLTLGAGYVQAQTACYTAWDATAVYTNGMQVSRSGNNYTAKWWTQNEDPATKSCTDCVWKLVGPCGSTTNTPPTVGLTAPTSGATFTAPASITISANAADANGTVSKVDFYQGSTLLFSDTSSPYSYTWTGVAAGTYSLTAKATDNGGASTTSSAVSVTVNPSGPTAQAVPGKIEAESFTAQSGTQTETTTDTGGGLNVDYFETGDWLDYYVNVASAGSYKVDFRVASANGAATFQLRTSGGTVLGSITIGNTGGWQSWQTISTSVTLPAGPQTLRVYASASTGCNLNWLAFSTAAPANQAPTVSLTAPKAGTSYAAPASITVSATASDADGTVSKVDFYQGTTLLGTATASPYSYTWTGVAAGTYSLTAKATDNSGASTTSSAVSVTVSGTTTNSGLPKRIMSGYWHSWNGGVPFIKLRDVNAGWDVINISFAEPVTAGSTDGHMHFVVSGLDASYTVTDFKADIKTLQGRGKKIVLSIGGYEGYFSLGSAAAVTQFAGDIKAIVNEYGFDGIDIDLEQSSLTFNSGADPDFKNPTSPKIVNMIAGIQQVLAAYPSTFILSWAPETFYLQLGHQYYAGTNANVDSRAGNYIPMVYALRNQTTYVQAQLYNSGQVQGNDGVLYSMGNTAADAAMTEMLVQGFTVGGPTGPLFPALRPDQVVIGVPASSSAAGSGQLSNADLQAAFNRVNNKYPGLRGIMSWSINWDAYQNANSFVSANSAFLKGLPANRAMAADPASPPVAAELSAYPNPALAGQRVALDLGGHYQTVQATVTDLAGRAVATYTFYDVNQAELPLPIGRAGVLLLHIVADGQTFTRRLTVH